MRLDNERQSSNVEDMRDRFKVAGDFAQAYVIAHKVGHHVQNLMGITDQLDSKRGRVSAWCPIHLHTARRRSACAGCARDWKPAM